jgi:DNA-binding transcriptional ArsR family regulator
MKFWIKLRAMPRAFNHPAAGDISLDTVLYALSDPMRRHIIGKLMASESMSCIQACATLPPSTVSFHHKILREAGLIRSEKKGVEVINTLRRADIDERFPGLLHAVFPDIPPRS